MLQSKCATTQRIPLCTIAQECTRSVHGKACTLVGGELKSVHTFLRSVETLVAHNQCVHSFCSRVHTGFDGWLLKCAQFPAALLPQISGSRLRVSGHGVRACGGREGKIHSQRLSAILPRQRRLRSSIACAPAAAAAVAGAAGCGDCRRLHGACITAPWDGPLNQATAGCVGGRGMGPAAAGAADCSRQAPPQPAVAGGELKKKRIFAGNHPLGTLKPSGGQPSARHRFHYQLQADGNQQRGISSINSCNL
jgi:hypothetical protein